MCDDDVFIFSGPPILQKSGIVTVKENEHNVAVTLSLPQATFPIPTFVSLQKHGGLLPHNNGITITHYGVLLHSVNRKHAGNYSLCVANYHLEDPSVLVGKDVGNFTIDVQCKYYSCD